MSERRGIAKAPTGIVGFDEMTLGGLPRARVTLVVGQAGSGKTMFALQTLVAGARDHSEPGIFVAFEERTTDLARNAENFGWMPAESGPGSIFFIDAQP